MSPQLEMDLTTCSLCSGEGSSAGGPCGYPTRCPVNSLPMEHKIEPRPADPPAPAPPMTERGMLDLLMARYGITYGNGFRYARAEHVRSHAGFEARRTADFVAMDLWPSKGLCLHGHEVKVSRSDWLNELKDPSKAAEFIPYMDFWWLVISDRHFVRAGELPEGWGLMVPRGQGLVVITPAARREALPLPRSRMAAFVRAVAKTATAEETAS